MNAYRDIVKRVAGLSEDVVNELQRYALDRDYGIGRDLVEAELGPDFTDQIEIYIDEGHKEGDAAATAFEDAFDDDSIRDTLTAIARASMDAAENGVLHLDSKRRDTEYPV